MLISVHLPVKGLDDEEESSGCQAGRLFTGRSERKEAKSNGKSNVTTKLPSEEAGEGNQSEQTVRPSTDERLACAG